MMRPWPGPPTPDILKRILLHKAEEVAQTAAAVPLPRLRERLDAAPAVRGFAAAIEHCIGDGNSAVIAEIKKASPSQGVLRADFCPAAIAESYARRGATCLSVLTDSPSFQGAPEDLIVARQATHLPVLRKDFMLDPYQIAQSRALGADCVLIIMAMVDDKAARTLFDAAKKWGMDALVEVHDEAELARALALGATLIGVNNRDLKTFATDLEISLRLKAHIPAECHVVAESGLSTPADLMRLAKAGITSYLIGESLMRRSDVETATHELLSAVRP